ncbi:MAG: hypothetical protein K2W96_26040, partial [Gemmataceae bacterium]|nr:hypothetical protein [Gemmataceae bacterium]
MAAGDGHGVIRVLDLRTGDQLDRHSVHPPFAGVRVIGGHVAASWTKEGRVVFWDLRTGEALRRQEAGAEPLLFSPDGERLVAGSRFGPRRLVETRTGRALARLSEKEHVVGFDSRGEELVCAKEGPAGKMRLERIDARTGRRGRPLDLDAPFARDSLALSPDGKTVLAIRDGEWPSDPREIFGAKDGTMSAFDAVAGKRIRAMEWAAGRYAFLLAFGRSGRRALVADHSTSTVFDPSTGRATTMVQHRGQIDQIVVSRGLRWLAAKLASEGVDLYDLEARHPATPVLRFDPARYTTRIDLDEDGSRLVSSHADGTCLVWDLAAMLRRAPARPDGAAWSRLGGDDPVPAMAALVEEPGRGVELLAGRLAAVPAADLGRFRRLLGKLDSDS